MLNQMGDLLLELHRGCRKQAAETFPHWAMALVREVIPNSAWFWGSGTEIDGEIIPHAFMFDNVPPESMLVWKQYEHLDILTARLLAQRNVVHNFTHEMFKDSEIYRLLYHSVGIEQNMGVYAYKPSCGLYDGISLYRSDPANPFSEEERQAMQCLVPHLIEARHINYLEHLSSGTQRAQQQSLAATDGKGVIHVADDEFVELMQAEWPEWRGSHLPEPLAKGLRNAAQRYAGRAIAVRFVPVLDMFLLKARPRMAVDGLSRRELEIARHFADGLTNKEIARETGLAPATVRNHLSSIYLKLGVDNKAELATLLSAWAD
ncbi:MAG: response regulator transcription factor [Gallionella sp.]|nr:response regulator transcription factor [Gallionella sp.]